MRLPMLILLAGLAVAVAVAGADVRAADGPGPGTRTLKQAFADDFLVGTAVDDDIVAGRDPQAQALVLRHFNAITLEDSMKAEAVNPQPGVYDFAAADAFVDFGERHGMFVVGHTLVWHNQTPDWFFFRSDGSPVGREALVERMRAHIERVAGRYVGRVDAWDVVNEQIGEDGGYRDTKWVTGIGDGDELLRLAFTYAARYAPDAELYYNDFNAWRPEKRDGIVRMVRMLQAHGIRIDGIGMQGHWGLEYPAAADVEAAIDAYAALGLKVMITELDVDVLPLTKEGQIIGTGMAHPQFQLPEFKRYLDPYRDGLPADVQRQLAERYAELFRIFHGRSDKIHRVALWGVHDGMSWKNDYPIPHRTNYPLLFDRERRPKPAFEAVLGVPVESAGP